MIELPRGSFIMGSPPGEAPAFLAAREQPMHRVEIDIPIAMGRNEVTFEEWMACVDDGGCDGFIPRNTFLSERSDGETVKILADGTYPVSRVSYLNVLSYIDWLNHKVGSDTYRLPTEAEWEFAARAGSQTPFGSGIDEPLRQLNTNNTWAAENRHVFSSGFLLPHPVQVEEMDAANAWGLRHMAGNLDELTMSCWTERHQTWDSSSDYLSHAQPTKQCETLVSKASSFAMNLLLSRAAVRSPIRIDESVLTTGFRVVREVYPLN